MYELTITSGEREGDTYDGGSFDTIEEAVGAAFARIVGLHPTESFLVSPEHRQTPDNYEAYVVFTSDNNPSDLFIKITG